ncbi:MAG: sigma-70 family RNA polymerase sigma factor, partial [marine benthic group bacterium]|nr:sigma-70 family RNA polymerase sigma factor [Candidatus Benthicola marisminoris]
EEETSGLVESVRIIALRRLADPHLAEDVAQETLVRALEALDRGRLEDLSRLPAYVRAIARNVIADHYRSTRGAISLGSAPQLELSRDSGNPLRDLLTEEDRRQVRVALGCLSQGDREILRQCYFEGLSPKTIAERNGEPAPRVWKRKSRALARLRTAFRSLEPEGQEAIDSPTEKRDPGEVGE